MTLAYLPERPEQASLRLVEERRRKGYAENLLRLPRMPRAAMGRVAIAAGHPKALSWDVTPWEDDDHAWYAVAHGGELTPTQIGAVMGVTDNSIVLTLFAALRKLREGFGALGVDLSPEVIARGFESLDRERHRDRETREVEQAVREGLAGAAE